MNYEHVKMLSQLAEWCRHETDLSVSFEIKVWSHKCYEHQTVEYSFWIDGIFSQSTKDSLLLITLIPYIKGICHKYQNQGIAA